MRLTRLLSALILSLLLGTITLAYAQEQHEDAKPAQDEPRPEATKPRQDEAKPQKQDDKDKSMRGEDKTAKQDDAKAGKQDGRQNERAQGTTGQRGGRIPDDKFRAHFGRQHTFKVNHVITVGGQPQFQYGGYSFTIIDVWPAGWAYTDQCYIDYIDGEYFLFDLLHPGVQVALIVVI